MKTEDAAEFFDGLALWPNNGSSTSACAGDCGCWRLVFGFVFRRSRLVFCCENVVSHQSFCFGSLLINSWLQSNAETTKLKMETVLRFFIFSRGFFVMIFWKQSNPAIRYNPIPLLYDINPAWQISDQLNHEIKGFKLHSGRYSYYIVQCAMCIPHIRTMNSFNLNPRISFLFFACNVEKYIFLQLKIVTMRKQYYLFHALSRHPSHSLTRRC